jgi:allantoicase
MLLSGLIFLVYSSICIICLIFTFSLDVYAKIEGLFNSEYFSNTAITVLDKNLDWFDDWVTRNHRKVGPILVIFSIFDLKLVFDTINALGL